MNSPDFESNPPHSENIAGEALEEAKETASEAVESGERCVRDHPASAIATAFAGGILLGILIGWSASESRHRDYRDILRDRARWWQHRLHFG